MAGSTALRAEEKRPAGSFPKLSADLMGIRKALNFNAEFSAEFDILKPYLARISRKWPYTIKHLLQADKELAPLLSADDFAKFDELMLRFTTELRSGRFYEDFEGAVAAMGSFLTAKGIPSSFLIGAIMTVFHEAQLELFFDKEARNGRVVVSALRCLLKIMTLTLQILNASTTGGPRPLPN